MLNKGQAEKPSIKEKVQAKLDRAQRIFLITNVLMTLIFAASSVMNMVGDMAIGALQYVIIAMLVAYVIAFVVLIVLFKKDKKNLKENMNNYKFAIKVMKKVVNLMNLAIALSIMVESFTLEAGPKQIFSFVVAVIGIVMAVFKFIMFIFKFIRKKKKAAKKEAKRAALKEARANRMNEIKGKLGLDTNSADECASDEVAVADSDSSENK